MIHGAIPSDSEGFPTDPTRLHGYDLEQLDRGADAFTFTAYAQIDGKGPVGMVEELAATQDRVVVLDAGCGTGRQLYELVHHPYKWGGRNVGHVEGHGVSNFDFRGLSRSEEVNEAFRPGSGRLRYSVEDLAHFGLKTGGEYDLIYSHEVLMHTKRPGLIVRNLWQTLREGGVMYFNAHAAQTPELAQVLRAIVDAGSEVVWMPMEGSVEQALTQAPGMRDPEQRLMYKIHKPKQHAWLDEILKKM